MSRRRALRDDLEPVPVGDVIEELLVGLRDMLGVPDESPPPSNPSTEKPSAVSGP